MAIRTLARPLSAWRILIAIFAGLLSVPFSSAVGQGAGAQIDEPQIPKDVDVFDLNLEQTRALSRSLNFNVVGHSYLKGPWLTAKGKAKGTGVGLNSVYVHDGIAYVSGYSDPPAFFGNLIVDVHNPKDMKVLSFIPCEAGARCTYQRVSINRHILVTGASIPGTDMSAAQQAQAPGAPAGGDQLPPGARPVAAGSDPMALGQALFRSVTPACNACHSVAPGVNLAGPTLAGLATRAAQIVASPEYKGSAKDVTGYIRESISEPSKHLIPGAMYSAGGTSFMPDTYAKALTPEQVDQLVDYLSTLK